ncbi:MAG TPA: hypothetical protein VK304_14800 [Thermoleophilaceae bacterium]|nr:hypothetical protein [Thermoleophilaceae bacterium]
MTTAMMVDNPQGSQEVYERVRDLLGDEGPLGGVLHLAGPAPNGGWRVIELWESEAAARRFFEERLLAAVEAVGAPALPAPQYWPIHSYTV